MHRIRSLLVPLSARAVPAAALAQRRVTGRITAEGTNEPLSSVSLTVVGTALGTVTTEDGTFTLRDRRPADQSDLVGVT